MTSHEVALACQGLELLKFQRTFLSALDGSMIMMAKLPADLGQALCYVLCVSYLQESLHNPVGWGRLSLFDK